MPSSRFAARGLRIRSLRPLLLLVIGALPSRVSVAGNVEPSLVGGQAMLSAGAVVAVVGDCGAGWYNPAGLAGLERTSIRIGVDTFMLRALRAVGMTKTSLPDGDHMVPLAHTEIFATPTALVVARQGMHARS